VERRARATLGVAVFLMLFGVVFTAWSHNQSQQLDRRFDALRAHGAEVTGYVESMTCSTRVFKSCSIHEMYDYQGARHTVTFIEDYYDKIEQRKQETLYVSRANPSDVVSQNGVPTTEAWKMWVGLGPILVGVGGIMLVVLVVSGRHTRRSRNYFDAVMVS
jgi:hypothetical protein